MVGDAGEHVGKVVLRIETVELGGFEQRIDRGSAAATAIGAGEQPVFAAKGNRPVILPISGRMSRYIIGAFAANMSSGAPAAMSFMSR